MTSRTRHEATCLIMAALGGESQDGSGIVARVRDISGGRVQLRVGTLFTALAMLCADDLVRIDRDEVVGGRLRRYYRLAPCSRWLPVEPPDPGVPLDLRISDAERDAAASALGEHFACGRLTAGELDARLDLALAAVTRRDISLAVQDLPCQHTWPEGGGGRGYLDHPASQAAEAP
jgi:hypothetical protein